MNDLQAEGRRDKKLREAKKWVGYCKVPFTQGMMGGVCQANYLASAAQAIPNGLV